MIFPQFLFPETSHMSFNQKLLGKKKQCEETKQTLQDSDMEEIWKLLCFIISKWKKVDNMQDQMGS